MGNFATARIAALTILLAPVSGAQADAPFPATLGYTFFVRGEPAGHADVRITESRDLLRIESKLRVATGGVVTELSTKSEADPRTYALRIFSFEGTKAGTPVFASVAVEGDSVFGAISSGGPKKAMGRRVTPRPIVVWEDWAMDLEILLALQQAREFRNSSTRGLLLAASYSSALVTMGFTGEALVESTDRSVSARKLLVAIQGGEPFESMIHPEMRVPVYIHFPGVRAEVFLDQFFGDNPVSRYATPATPAKGR